MKKLETTHALPHTEELKKSLHLNTECSTPEARAVGGEQRGRLIVKKKWEAG